MAKSKRPLIRICVAPGEYGWAWDLGHGFAKIANIPVKGPFNLMDVVKIGDPRNGTPSILAVVSRSYASKSIIEYSRDEQFNRFRKALKKAGCAVEGLMAPSRTRSGWMAVASPPGVNAEEILMSIEGPPSSKPLR